MKRGNVMQGNAFREIMTGKNAFLEKSPRVKVIREKVCRKIVSGGMIIRGHSIFELTKAKKKAFECCSTEFFAEKSNRSPPTI
jgi:hypothetical protein